MSTDENNESLHAHTKTHVCPGGGLIEDTSAFQISLLSLCVAVISQQRVLHMAWN